MYRSVAVVSAVVFCVFAAVPASAQRTVVFGDSLSDPGNIAGLSGGTQPAPVLGQAPGSPLGRFSTGLNWADFVFGSNPVPGIVAPTTTGYVNFATGGAYAGTGNLGNGSPPGAAGLLPGTNDQINLFAGLGGRLSPTDTVAIWSGANNGFFALNFTPTLAGITTGATTAAANEVANVRSLAALGARNVIVLNLPELGSLPAIVGTAGAAGGTLFSGTFNDALATGLTQVASGVPGINIVQVNVAALFRAITANPAAFGFTNVTGFCGFRGGAACAGFGFADSVHPTEAGYAWVAQLVRLTTNTAPAIAETAILANGAEQAQTMVSNAVFGRLSSFVAGTYADRNGPYAEVLGQFGSYDRDGTTSAYDLTLGGFRAGIDSKNGPTLAGGSLTYLTGGTSSSQLNSDLTSFRGDLYGTALFGNAYVSGDLGLASLTFDGIERETGIPTVTAKASTNGYVASAAGEIGFVQKIGSITFIPSARATYFHTEVEGYSEAASLLALSYSDRTLDNVLLGGRVKALVPVAGLGIATTVFGEAGYEDYVSTSGSEVTGRLVGNTALPTTVRLGDPAGPGLLGKIGISSQLAPTAFLDAEYGIAVHQTGGETHSGNVRLKATY
ncbi:MAG: autotransporter domain-containing protein [Hyphomicrobiaceae bacterium]|nr:autotransporter domain-containing protein [Hyphomicrobiaceae bacterium]